MSSAFARTDHSIVGRWWWTVDRWTLVALAVLIGVGALLVTAASPSVAERIHLPTFYFVIHQAVMLIPTLILMLGVSLLSPRGVRRLALGAFVIFYLLTAATLFFGSEIKGATRWVSVGPLSVQPSEFLKPAFAVVSAWLFARQHAARAAGQFFPGYFLAVVTFVAVVMVLMLQPDFGMTFVCTAIWFAEFFLAGLPIVFVLALAVMAVGGLVGAYFIFPHIASRIDRFLDPASGDTYQVDRSLEAFIHGGLTGTGPGQGTVKLSLPDAHADFIFAVAGEELGLAATLFIVALFGFIVLRGFARALKDTDLFVVLAVGGLFTQFGLQALIHMGSSLHLLPAKGMTLPFISYGGSSMLALGMGTGMALALTRIRFPGERIAMTAPLVILAAGGTGGHMFPAEALARALIARNIRVALITDQRGQAFGETLPSVDVYRIRASRLPRHTIDRLRAVLEMGLGGIEARRLLGRLNPAMVVGFGGYPSIPTVFAASLAKIPIVLHEQNALLGRANRRLASRAQVIATSFETVAGVPAGRRTVLTGNPVRPGVIGVRDQPYVEPTAGGPFSILVTGGSQGARILSEVVPAAVALLPDALKTRLKITQQCRQEDIDAVAAEFRQAGIDAELATFFSDMPARLAACHLAIARSGASTVAELGVAGRPAILIPYPFATDDHQTNNAEAFTQSGGGWVISQRILTPKFLADRIAGLASRPDTLARAAEAARQEGRPDAADRFAELVIAEIAAHPRRALVEKLYQGYRRMRALPLTIGTVHFVGIGGIGMSGIAEVLHNLGYSVQGSDVADNPNVRRLRGLGISIAIGHAAENLGDATVVVVSSAIKPENPELAAARAALLPVVRRAEMLGELMRLKWSIAVAGTHGKTTTTSLVAAVLEGAGYDPTVINGGIINAYGTNTRLGAGDWMVVEADESDGTFVKLPATIAIVTNIDPEHLDHFGTFEGVKAAFDSFVQNIPFYGFAALCIDHPEVQAMIPRVADRRIITYGFSPQADIRALNVDSSPDGSIFDLEINGRGGESRTIPRIHLSMLGRHNVQNACAAIAVANEMQIEDDAIRNALARFQGVKRRFTKTGVAGGVTVIDDYGHHPVEISAVLKAARLAVGGHPGAKVIAVVQPHRYTRLASLFEDFCTCFNDADMVIVADVYAAGETPIAGVDRDALVAGLQGHGHRHVAALPDPAALAGIVAEVATAGDFVVCLGAGSITNWAASLPGELTALSGGRMEAAQ